MTGITMQDLARVEEKIDRLATAVEKLILIEERQATQAAKITQLESRLAVSEANLLTTDRKVDQWVNRGIGVWGLATVVIGGLVAYFKR